MGTHCCLNAWPNILKDVGSLAPHKTAAKNVVREAAPVKHHSQPFLQNCQDPVVRSCSGNPLDILEYLCAMPQYVSVTAGHLVVELSSAPFLFIHQLSRHTHTIAVYTAFIAFMLLSTALHAYKLAARVL